MFSDLPAEDLLRTIAANLETTVLPALSGRGERRQCRTAVYLLRALAAALPDLDIAIDADIADAEPLLHGVQPSGIPVSSLVQRRAHRNELVRELSDAMADSSVNVDREAARSIIRSSLDRWVTLFPPGDLGGYVNLDHTPANDQGDI